MNTQNKTMVDKWLDQSYSLNPNMEMMTYKDVLPPLSRRARRYLEQRLKKGRKVTPEEVMEQMTSTGLVER